MASLGSKLSWLHAKQILFPLYYRSGPELCVLKDLLLSIFEEESLFFILVKFTVVLGLKRVVNSNSNNIYIYMLS